MVSVLWSWLAACASMGGLVELDRLPADFPLALDAAEVGQITTPRTGGQVAVDLVFETEEEARAGWDALRDQALAAGFVAEGEGKVGKRDRRVFAGPAGRLELSCCPKRADTAVLVFVSWWRPAG